MTSEEYRIVTSKSVVPCVDLVILRKLEEEVLETLLLRRKPGYEKGKWCIIGGRQYKGEVLEETINRQAGDLGVTIRIITPFEYNFPAWTNDNPEQDKTKHSC